MRTELRRRGWLLVLATAIVSIAACDDEETTPGGAGGAGPTPEVIEATLSGDQEVPPVATEATGSMRVELLEDNLTLTGTFQGLGSDLLDIQGSPAHFHQAARGQAGPIILNVDVTPGADNRSGTLAFDGRLTAAQLTEFRAGNLYVNVHSEDHPTGEIRAQVEGAGTGEIRFNVRLTPAAEVPTTLSPATGTANVVLAGNDLTLDGSFQGLTSELHDLEGSPAHVHRAAAGQNGPIIANLEVVPGTDGRSGTFSLERTLSAAERAAFLANELYLNVHSSRYPDGEIRAQLRREGAVVGGGSGGGSGGSGGSGSGTGGTGGSGSGTGGSGGPGY